MAIERLEIDRLEMKIDRLEMKNMAIDRLEMKNYNMILIEKLQKFQPYQAKLTSMNMLQVKKYYLLIKNK